MITGPELEVLPDDELLDRIGELHVFGRVSPQDKVRMVEVLQRRGDIVAMTGDAVNDAAAVKKADVGVAMGAGSEVTKQSARMILTDNNFATLVHAIELGRDIYGKISAQIRYVLTGLFGLLGIMLFGSLFNINSGSVLSAVQLLFVSFLIGLFPAIAISTDTAEPGLMQMAPRDPRIPIMNAHGPALAVGGCRAGAGRARPIPDAGPTRHRDRPDHDFRRAVVQHRGAGGVDAPRQHADLERALPGVLVVDARRAAAVGARRELVVLPGIAGDHHAHGRSMVGRHLAVVGGADRGRADEGDQSPASLRRTTAPVALDSSAAARMRRPAMASAGATGTGPAPARAAAHCA